MNQTMKIREHTCTPVTITEVLTIPAAQQLQKKKTGWELQVTLTHLCTNYKQKSLRTDGTMSHLKDKTHINQNQNLQKVSWAFISRDYFEK